MRSPLTLRVGGIAALLVLCGSALVAQQSTGAFKGRVVEKGSRAPLSDILVTAKNLDTGFVRTTKTNKDGLFRFSIMPLGEYQIRFAGPSSESVLTCACLLGQQVDASVALAPVAQATVIVESTLDTVGRNNVSSAEMGINVTAERLQSLPVLSRNVVQAAVLAPGVQLVQGGNVDPTKKTSTYMTTGASQGRGTNFNIDGGDNNSTDVGGYISTLPFDAIDQFQVVTNQYKAEFGRSNAGFLNVVSKAGGNTFSGSVSSQFTNQSLRAMTADEHKKKNNSTLNLGALVSGPILKDKLFFMASVDRRDEENAAATFSSRVLESFPDAADLKAKIKQTSFYGRLDWNVSPILQATFTYGYDLNKTPNQSSGMIEASGGNGFPSLLGTGLNKTTRYGLKTATTLSSNMIWESSLVYFDYTNTIRPNPDPLGKNSYFSIREQAFTGMDVNPNTALLTGFDPNTYQNTGIRRFQWRNDLTASWGAHSFKAGIDYQRYTMADVVTFMPFTGIMGFRVAGISNGVDFYSPTVDADVNISRLFMFPRGYWPGDTIQQYGVYAQNEWTITPKWLVYVGLRADKDTCFDFMQQDFIKQLYRDIYSTSPAFIRGATPPKDKTYLSPRLQVVWKPNGDDTQAYKLGYGHFVANVVDNITGYARQLMARVNGIPTFPFCNQASVDAGAVESEGVFVQSFRAGTLTYVDPSMGGDVLVNGHPVVLPADLTPYNYANNVNGLQDYFRYTVDSWLERASFSTGGKQLLTSNFQYPETDTFSLSGAWTFGTRHNLELTFLYSKTQHASTLFASDGSLPAAASIGPEGGEMGDTLYLSNQQAEMYQLQAKYAYTSPRWNGLFNVVFQNARSSYGGAGMAFDQTTNSDFYGSGATYPYLTNKMRPAHGSEKLAGSFAVNHLATWGTSFGLLGTWHSPKIYDIYLGYGPDGEYSSLANPNPVVAQGEGCWGLDLNLRVAHAFKIGPKISVEPYVQVQNILNNYDYGTNFQNYLCAGPGMFLKDCGERLQGYTTNLPRTFALGVRAAF